MVTSSLNTLSLTIIKLQCCNPITLPKLILNICIAIATDFPVPVSTILPPATCPLFLGVINASVLFMSEKVTIEANDEDFDNVIEEVKKAAKKQNPDWIITR